jgi:hypothetical protein
MELPFLLTLMRRYVFILFIFCFANSFAQDSTKHTSPFPKNNFKVNILSPFVHTVTASYERMVSKRWGIELEAGYIFPLSFTKYTYDPYSPFPGSPRPLWPSTGFLGRAGVRYYALTNEKADLLLFTGAGIIYKYRHYSNTYFYNWAKRESDYMEAVRQSQKNRAYAGELNFGVRYYPGHKHLLMEASMGIDAGAQKRITDVYAYYTGSSIYIPPKLPHIEETKFYFSINPCIKFGYTF